jgi:hypothetical protein
VTATSISPRSSIPVQYMQRCYWLTFRTGNSDWLKKALRDEIGRGPPIFAVVLLAPTFPSLEPRSVTCVISLTCSSLCVAGTACLSQLTGEGGTHTRKTTAKSAGLFLDISFIGKADVGTGLPTKSAQKCIALLFVGVVRKPRF